tara:strand:- start:196 stop:450 length:255 start_codon:yes stop_codon:yes gene_type:complete
MNCWRCKEELIWGGDHDIEEEADDYDMVTNLSCPKCHCLVDVYHPSAKLLREYKDSYKDREKMTESEKMQEELEPLPLCPMTDD